MHVVLRTLQTGIAQYVLRPRNSFIRNFGLCAQVPICAGEELSYNYSMKWFGDPDYAQRCYCMSINCTGYMGPPPKNASPSVKAPSGKSTPKSTPKSAQKKG